MKIFELNHIDPIERIRQAIQQSMQIYVNRLIEGYYEFGTEASFQLHFSSILDRLLVLNTNSTNESFTVMLEKNYPIQGQNDKIDISVTYKNETETKTVLIELKNKKITDSASDNGNIDSYIDIYTLSTQLYGNNENMIDGAFFIFLTDLQTYPNIPIRGTRVELPMYDGAVIKKNTHYMVSGRSAKERTTKYPNGFYFIKEYKIEYTKFFVTEKPFCYFMIEL